MMPRASADVVAQLLRAMTETVNDYGTLKRTNDAIDTIIQGTAVFPGGAGLWRGEAAFGNLPAAFPDGPIMFIGHNFDKESSYRDSLARGIERIDDDFWRYLCAYIHAAGVGEEQCFFTNALMGLQPIKASGPMEATDLFRAQCRAFLMRQIAIVNPRCIAVLGEDAAKEVRQVEVAIPRGQLLHPSALRYQKRELHAGILAEQSARLKRLWESRGPVTVQPELLTPSPGNVGTRGAQR